LPSVENTGALSTKLAPPSLTIPSPSFTLLQNYCVSPLLHARSEIQDCTQEKLKKKHPEALTLQEGKEQEEQARRPGSR
jgi:hypothetical protein